MSDLQVLDHPGYAILWTREGWHEDKIEFARDWCRKNDITHLPGASAAVKRGRVNRFISEVLGRPVVDVYDAHWQSIEEAIPSSLLRMLGIEVDLVDEVVGNLLVNEGIQRLEDLTMIATVLTNQTLGNAWTNAAGGAFLGVGDSSTAEAATQTELQAATNRFYKAMNATFPSRASQTVSFQSDFTTTEANYAWAEWSISAGATTASGAGFTTGTTNLNRKVASLGTKASGTWTLTSQVTFS